MLHFLEVQQQILQPQARPLADRRRLRRLEVGEAERRQVAVAAREVGQRRNGRDQSLAHQLECIPLLDQLGVVGDERAGRAQVNERLRLRRHLPEAETQHYSFLNLTVGKSIRSKSARQELDI